MVAQHGTVTSSLRLSAIDSDRSSVNGGHTSSETMRAGDDLDLEMLAPTAASSFTLTKILSELCVRVTYVSPCVYVSVSVRGRDGCTELHTDVTLCVPRAACSWFVRAVCARAVVPRG